MGNRNIKSKLKQKSHTGIAETLSNTADSSIPDKTSLSILDNDLPVPRIERRITQGFTLAWIDKNLDETKPDFQNSLVVLRQIAPSIQTFTSTTVFFDSINEETNEKIFLIVSGSIGQEISSKLETMESIESVYVFCKNKDYHSQWAKQFQKVKGVFTHVTAICNAVEIDRQQSDRSTIPIVFNGLDAVFVYTQLLKDAVIEIDDDSEKSVEKLVEYCRQNENINTQQITMLEKEYKEHTAIWWYTAETFLYPTLNRSLRDMDTEIIQKMGFYIRDLHNDIVKLYKEQNPIDKEQSAFTLYRGQGLSISSFEKLAQSKGKLMSFNNFLSTSRNRSISLEQFARPRALRKGCVGILFVINVNPMLSSKSMIPYAAVGSVGAFQDKEEETLFTTHTVFRINSIENIPDPQTDRLYQVHLTLVSAQDSELNGLLESLRKELLEITPGWPRFGYALLKLGSSVEAERLFRSLLDSTLDEKHRANYIHALGKAYWNMGQYNEALLNFEKSKEMRLNFLSENHPDIGRSYDSIGVMYYVMGDHKKSLEYLHKSLDILLTSMPSNHPELGNIYSSIGNAHLNAGEFQEAVNNYQKSLEIKQQTLPDNHHDLAQSYMDIGTAYCHLGEYSKSLENHKRSREILMICRPPNHPDIPISLMTLGGLYMMMGEYDTALRQFEEALEIQNKILSEDHPNIAACFQSIASVYFYLGDFTKSLSFYQDSLRIFEKAFSPDHMCIGDMHMSIALTYASLKEYDKAIQSYDKALEIKSKSPDNQPNLALCYLNMSDLYIQLEEYAKARENIERAIQIQKQVLPEDHPDLADSYAQLGDIYSETNDLIRAQEYYEKSLDLRRKCQPETHPNFGRLFCRQSEIYLKLGDFPKALSLCQDAEKVLKVALPENHPDLLALQKSFGSVYKAMGKYEEAYEYYNKCISILQELNPPDTDKIAECQTHINDLKERLSILRKD